MKKRITLLLLTSWQLLFAQNNDFDWAKRAYLGATTKMQAIACDKQGNTYCVGYVDETSNPYKKGIGIMKYDFTGNEVWKKTLETYTNSSNAFIDTDENNNIYIVCEAASNIIIIDSTVVTQKQDIVTLKLSPDGDILWFNVIGGSGNDEFVNAWLDPQGELYVSLEYGNYFFNNTSIGWVPQYKEACIRIESNGEYHGIYNGVNAYNIYQAHTIDANTSKLLIRSINSTTYKGTLETRTVTKTGEWTTTNSIEYSANGNQKILKAEYLANNDRYFILYQAYGFNWNGVSYPVQKTEYSYSLLHLNTDLSIIGHIQMSNFKNFNACDSLVAIQGLAHYDWLINGDSIHSATKAPSIVTTIYDHDFNKKRHFQVNTVDILGFKEKGLDFDTSGRIVSQYLNEEDMIWGDSMFVSSHKSWGHMTIIGKEINPSKVLTILNSSKNELPFSYANPVSSNLKIQFTHLPNEVVLTDNQGTIIHTSKPTNPSLEINCSKLASGIYYLSIRSKEQVFSKKIFIQ